MPEKCRVRHDGLKVKFEGLKGGRRKLEGRRPETKQPLLRLFCSLP
jgi:hypothetical protein